MCVYVCVSVYVCMYACISINTIPLETLLERNIHIITTGESLSMFFIMCVCVCVACRMSKKTYPLATVGVVFENIVYNWKCLRDKTSRLSQILTHP